MQSSTLFQIFQVLWMRLVLIFFASSYVSLLLTAEYKYYLAQLYWKLVFDTNALMFYTLFREIH